MHTCVHAWVLTCTCRGLVKSCLAGNRNSLSERLPSESGCFLNWDIHLPNLGGWARLSDDIAAPSSGAIPHTTKVRVLLQTEGLRLLLRESWMVQFLNSAAWGLLFQLLVS